MSRYGYDYSLAPGRPNGWRSAFGNILTIGTIVVISAISGSVVALNLLGSANPAADQPTVVAAHPVPSARAARATAPTTPQMPQLMIASTNAVAAAAPPLATHAVAAQPAAPAPQAAPAAPPQASAAPDEPATASVPDNELTFTRGYARRRAVQAAAHTTSGAGAGVAVARVESQTQLGRAALKAKPRTLARQYGQDQRHVADAGGLFSRFDSQQQSDNRFDFGRHQALAYGDQRTNRRPAPQSGGLGGFFRGLF